MDFVVALAVLVAALLHATWHALVKTSGDRVLALAGMNLVSGTAALAVIPFVAVPAVQACLVIAFSVLLHVAYKLALARLYSRVDFSVAYPVARGLTPGVATLLALIVVGERPSLLAMAGIVAISSGILFAVADRVAKMPWSGLAAAAAAGTAVAAYSVLDAYGVRINGDWLGFTAWLVAADSLMFVTYALATRGRAALLEWRGAWLRTLASGLLGTVSFGVFLWALARAHVGPVAALRETSIVLAALIGAIVLRERATPARLTATALVTLGAAAIGLAR